MQLASQLRSEVARILGTKIFKLDEIYPTLRIRVHVIGDGARSTANDSEVMVVWNALLGAEPA